MVKATIVPTLATLHSVPLVDATRCRRRHTAFSRAGNNAVFKSTGLAYGRATVVISYGYGGNFAPAPSVHRPCAGARSSPGCGSSPEFWTLWHLLPFPKSPQFLLFKLKLAQRVALSKSSKTAEMSMKWNGEGEIRTPVGLPQT